MRLLVDAEIQPETIDRLRALSPDLEVIDRSQDDTFDATVRYFDDLAVENVRRYLAAEPLLNLVDAGRGY